MTKKILIVDDEAHMRRVLQLSLERAGYLVSVAHDGQAGLEAAMAAAPDLLITDINMPRMCGREMVKALHAARPDRAYPIIVMTSLTAREERVWVQAIPNVDFLEKPVSARDLVVRLRAVFAGAAAQTAGVQDA